ncbi:pilus assembly protein [Clostridium sp. AF15-17LB]|nr:pilus assembly protein [Clostridium sp. AF15-17LB]
MLKERKLNGSMTVEMSFIMPVILLLVMQCITAAFYFHDKNIISGAAYETAVVGSTKARKEGGTEEGELRELFQERIGGKCILFPGADACISISETAVVVTASASVKRMGLSVIRKARITEPEKYIRDMRRIGK